VFKDFVLGLAAVSLVGLPAGLVLLTVLDWGGLPAVFWFLAGAAVQAACVCLTVFLCTGYRSHARG
jgi:hypothetical protein